MAKYGDYVEDTTPADGDLILTKDVSATATKKVTLLNLIKALVSFVSSFTAAGTLDGSELIAVSQGGNPRKTTLTDVVALAGGGGSTLPVADTTALVKGSADATKLVRIEADGLTTGTTRVITPPDADTKLPVMTQTLTFSGPSAARTITLPDANVTVARTDAAQTFTGNQTFSGQILLPDGTGAAPAIAFSGETDMGFYKAASNTTRWTPDGGTNYVDFRSNALSTNGFGGVTYTQATGTSPSLCPDVIFDQDTGVGHAGADQLSLIAGGVERARMDTTNTSGQTALLVFENGTLFRVKVGSAGTGPGGSGRALYID